MSYDFDVVVIGGGVVGNACALTLAQLGLRVSLVSSEQKVSLSKNFDTRIYALSGSSVQLLKKLRVWDALQEERMCAVRDMRIMGDAGAVQAQQSRLHFNAYIANQSELAWIVEQSNIQAALLQAIQFSPNITAFTSIAKELSVNDAGVRVKTIDDQAFSAHLVIGCDGADSWVRQLMGIGCDIFDYEQSAVVANFACSLPHQGCAYQWFLNAGSVLALLPLPNQQVSMVYSCSTEEAHNLVSLDDVQLSQQIGLLSHGTLGQLSTRVQAQSFSLKRRRAHRFIAERVILMGDAAHTVHPLAGQGLNLGLQDLATFQRLLIQRESFRSINDFIVLRRYERERKAVTAQMQGVTHILNRVFSHSHPAMKHVRNMGMSLLDHTSPLKQWLIKSATGQRHNQS